MLSPRVFLRFAAPLVFALAIPAAASAQEPTDKPSFSLAFERVGGVSYARAAEKSDDGRNESGSLTTFGVGLANVNPYAFTRLGVDYLTPAGLTVGGGIGVARFSMSSTSSSGVTRDQGSVTAYLINPRVGYRIPLSPKFDLTPRIGVTFLGGGVSPSSSNGETSSGSIFSVAVGGEGVAAYRLTPSFNLLAGAAFDHTVAASVTNTQKSPTGSTTETEKVKGSLFSAQLWLGIGGYL
jgi:hypothetical protein